MCSRSREIAPACGTHSFPLCTTRDPACFTQPFGQPLTSMGKLSSLSLSLSFYRHRLCLLSVTARLRAVNFFSHLTPIVIPSPKHLVCALAEPPQLTRIRRRQLPPTRRKYPFFPILHPRARILDGIQSWMSYGLYMTLNHWLRLYLYDVREGLIRPRR